MAKNLTDSISGFLKDKRYLIKEYTEHHHTEPPHQEMDNEIIEPHPQRDCLEWLGGFLKSYRRAG